LKCSLLVLIIVHLTNPTKPTAQHSLSPRSPFWSNYWSEHPNLLRCLYCLCCGVSCQ